MPIITEIARAKINLTLDVLGRRDDGSHELASLVAFADIGDVVTLDTDAATAAVTVSGPFASALVGENLITKTLRRLAQTNPALTLGAVHLEKNLPVAAGIGGGSADAAAVLRAVMRVNAEQLSFTQPSGPSVSSGPTGPTGMRMGPWNEIAASIGADVPVCLANTTSWMTGVGNDLQAVPGVPALNAVLVNALRAVPPDKTARVFRALAAPLVKQVSDRGRLSPTLAALPQLTSDPARHAQLLAFMRERGNALQSATQQVVPSVAEVLAALRGPGPEFRSTVGVPVPDLAAPDFVAMSGAGPTCFALFKTAEAAQAAAVTLRLRQPTWWVATACVGGPP